MRAHLFCILLLLLVVVSKNAFAQSESSPVQPVIGFAWPTHSIPVSIAAPRSDVRQLVLNAMSTWNLAQEWFITTYTGRGTPLVLYETNSTFDSMVTVSFNQTQTTDYLGWTKSHEFHDRQGNFVQVTVTITIDLTKENGANVSATEIQTIATHELGHALGLDHTTFNEDDLMNPIPKVSFPSTLNLYAVYLLSEATNIKDIPQEPVSLPNGIPYTIISQDYLSGVTAPLPTTTQTKATSSAVSQILYQVAYGPWLWLGLLAALCVVVISSTTRRRRSSRSEKEVSNEPQPTLQQRTEVVERVAQRKNMKTCRFCKAEVPEQYRICPECGMPASYL